jgi:hypothetical protein
MALVEMKRSKAAKKKDAEGPSIGGDDYPYGLRVNLDHESLQKLGIDKLPSVGDKMHLHAHAHVVSAEERSSEGGKKHRSVSLELRKMQIGEHEGETASQTRLANGAKKAMDEVLPGSKE